LKNKDSETVRIPVPFPRDPIKKNRSSSTIIPHFPSIGQVLDIVKWQIHLKINWLFKRNGFLGHFSKKEKKT
jgi:hypothetical protein